MIISLKQMTVITLLSLVLGLAFSLITNQITVKTDDWAIDDCYFMRIQGLPEVNCSREQKISTVYKGWPYRTHATSYNEPGHQESTSRNEMAYIPFIDYETPWYGFWGNFIIFTFVIWLFAAAIQTYRLNH